MEYKSINQITKEFKARISDDITAKEIQDELRKMGYLNRKNLPTENAMIGLHYIEAHDFRGRRYYKWEQSLVDDIGDRLFARYWC